MLRSIAFIMCLLTVLTAGASTGAMAAEWVIKKATGRVFLVSPEVAAFRAKRGMVLEPGFTLATQGNGRAILARGDERILVGPDTAFALSKYQSTDTKTTLLQRNGEISVDVETRGVPHFKVETPYLAAVVKGTRFTVSVGQRQAAVEVDRGVVEVSDLATGDVAAVRAGQRAGSATASTPGLSLSGKGPKSSVRKGRAQSPSFAAGASLHAAQVEDMASAGYTARGNRKSNSAGYDPRGNADGNGNAGLGNGNRKGKGNGNGKGNGKGNGGRGGGGGDD
ncbi:hypothetical protein GR183_11900 [Stappia sp. GBMRC 2046]|uniref:FecR protein domain-containing protein n=1 Tax=Stappia sediminis TaxID=2692190 RepID=A0A7X3LV03_9HYPH|nr:FecR family protein [Stappia sediminis]MXN65607.1 hypothetical protein [Stappia sediminis]